MLFKDGNYTSVLKPGKYYLNPFVNNEVKVLDINKPFDVPGKNINLFLSDEVLIRELNVIDVQDNEIALHYEDNKFAGVYKAGKYAFWNILKKHDFIIG